MLPLTVATMVSVSLTGSVLFQDVVTGETDACGACFLVWRKKQVNLFLSSVANMPARIYGPCAKLGRT